MSYLCLCDVCQQVIKLGDKKYILGLNSTQQTESESYSYNSSQDGMESLQDLIGRMENRTKHVKVLEICEKCKRVFDHFINLRIERVKKIALKLEKIEKGERKNVKKRQNN